MASSAVPLSLLLCLCPGLVLLPPACTSSDIAYGWSLARLILFSLGPSIQNYTASAMRACVVQVIELLLESDGDIMKFAGDSMIVAFWPSDEEAASPDKGLKAATLRAAACAQQLVEKFGAMKMRPTGEADPVPPEERAKDPVVQAPEGEWFEDFVNR